MDFTKYEEQRKELKSPERLTYEEKKRIKEINKKLEMRDELKESIVESLDAELKVLTDKQEQYLQQLKEVNRKSSEIDDQFKQDLFEELGVENHPKRDKLYELAKEHSSGTYNEIYYSADEFSELMV